MKVRWTRRSPQSTNNFDLVLLNVDELDAARIEQLLDAIVEERHRGLTLSERALKEFRRWLRQPSTPLKSEAYVLVSNWFMTQSGDRNSMVATRCEALWDELLPCRPLERLSSPAAGQNHIVVASEFQRFWQLVLKAQAGAESSAAGDMKLSPIVRNLPESGLSSQMIDVAEHTSSQTVERSVTALFVKNGLRFEIAGSPCALAQFLRFYSEPGTLTRQPDPVNSVCTVGNDFDGRA